MATLFYAVFAPSAPPGGTTATVEGFGTAGLPSGGVLTVQGQTGMTPLAVSPSAYPSGRKRAYLLNQSYSTTPVTTSAYVQLTASLSTTINWLSIFDSSGSAMILAVGPPGGEIDTLYVPPGGLTSGYPISIPAGAAISYKALTVNATSGNLIMTGLN